MYICLLPGHENVEDAIYTAPRQPESANDLNFFSSFGIPTSDASLAASRPPIKHKERLSLFRLLGSTSPGAVYQIFLRLPNFAIQGNESIQLSITRIKRQARQEAQDIYPQ